MTWVSPIFLGALFAAAGPLIIHLLNKRRHRVVEWAAMDFLREALHRNKRMMEIRDLLLLLLRTLAIIFFVLAMAQPYFVSEDTGAYKGGPVHAVILVDNSLSMGYLQLDRTLLAVAREKAKDFVERLPGGSEISIIPLCGKDNWHASDVYATTQDALEALDSIEPLDRAAHATDGIERARQACASGSAIPTKRVVFIGDMQARSWSLGDVQESINEIGGIQVVQVSPPSRDNTWVSDLYLRDGIADAESPAVINAVIRHEGEARPGVRATLKVDDNVVDERFVDLLPGQSLELMFKHQFDVAGTSLEPLFVPVSLELAEDHLPGDDFRKLVAPIVARVPVLFIDQHGSEEAPDRNKYGETLPLRRLLSPRTVGTVAEKQLIDVRHSIADAVTQEDLAEVRMVAIAGVAAPSPTLVDLLREYVLQGGQLFIAAGAEFDPLAWQDAAWLSGAGILPAPLRDDYVGALPQPDALEWPSFRLDPASFAGELFHFDLPEREMKDLITAPFFYQAVGIDETGFAELAESERARLEVEATQEAPNWLRWTNPLARDLSTLSLDELAGRGQPRVLARFDNGEAYAIRRDIGKGRVVMLTSGVFPLWNNIAVEHSVLLFDQVMRALMSRSLPERTMEAVNQFVVPVAARDQRARFTLQRPGEEAPITLGAHALGESQFGLVLRGLDKRGIYHVHRAGSDDRPFALTLAFNGPSMESELRSVNRDSFVSDFDAVRWVGLDDDISLEGITRLGHNTWKFLLLAALICLFGEMVILALPAFKANQ
jgi:hypothetical protein